LLLLPLSLVLSSCADDRADAIRLTMISPHRDEIREEVALAFRDWFHARTDAHAAAACDALEQWLRDGSPEQLSGTRQALARLRADWRSDDMGSVGETLQAWMAETDATQGRHLLDSLKAWRQQIPLVRLVWVDMGGTSQIARYITSSFESKPDGIGIDVLFGGGTDIFLRFADQGLLQRIDVAEALRRRIPPALNGVPIYDPQGRWYGPMLSSFGILSNREVLRRIGQPEPRSWADLGRPGLQGWVAAGDPRLTGSVHMVYEIVLQSQGWDKGFPLLLRLGANTHSFIRDSGTLCRTVSNAEVAAAGNLDANALTAVGRDPERIAFYLPPGETIINPDAMAILRGAPRPEAARAFVEFALSDAGQLLFLLQPGRPGGPRRFPLCRLSVVPELYERYPASERSVGEANPFKVANTISYDSKLGISRWDALNDLIGAVIVDAHPELSEAWRAVLQSGPPDPERQRLEGELFAPPCSESELREHARRVAAEGPRVRTLTLNRWGEEARQRYRAVRDTAKAGPK
jgi:ABC-type Fe3+ transport system substrate-binding protein